MGWASCSLSVLRVIYSFVSWSRWKGLCSVDTDGESQLCCGEFRAPQMDEQGRVSGP